MMEALERFEVAARTVWAHAMSETYGPHPHMEVDPFTDRDEYFESFVNLMKETKRSQRNSEEISHYLNHYETPFLPPIWIIISVMSFGELFRWIKNTKSTQVKEALQKPPLPSRMEQKCSVRLFLTTPECAVFLPIQ